MRGDAPTIPSVGDLVKTVSRGEWWWSQKLGIVVHAEEPWVRVQVIGGHVLESTADPDGTVVTRRGLSIVQLRYNEVMILSQGASSS